MSGLGYLLSPSKLEASLRQAPDNPTLLRAMAVTLYAREDYALSLNVLKRLTRQNPRDSQSHLAMARVLVGLGSIKEAEKAYSNARALSPRDGSIGLECGRFYLAERDTHRAIGLFTELILGDPGFVSAYYGLARCCTPGREWRLARQLALTHVPMADSINLTLALGRALIGEGRLEEAEECYDEALVFATQLPNALCGLGDIAYQRREFDRALHFHGEALAIDRFHRGANLGSLFDYCVTNRYDQARTLFRQAKTGIRPVWGHGSQCRGIAPEWDGSESLEGRSVLLHGPVGYGDAIQYARFCRFLKQAGARVLVESRKHIISLLGTMSGLDLVIGRYELEERVDFELDMRELFLIMQTSVACFEPLTPYVHLPDSAQPDSRKHWDDTPHSSTISLGIAWRGSRNSGSRISDRSINVETLLPILSHHALQIVSLQQGATDAEISFLNSVCSRQVINAGSTCRDFVDTASATCDLDAVVTVDTAIAHLSGALGKTTFLMLPYCASWRWSTDKSSVWYPTLVARRQRVPGEWASVIAEVRGDLARTFRVCE